jgi:predicted SAM-dependent methyltransferase
MANRRVNVGCGGTPTPGWVNFDNSTTIRLASVPVIGRVLAKVPLPGSRRRFVQIAYNAGIRWADATSHLPLPSNSVEVLYSSHMVEHLDRGQARAFLGEVLRVLEPGGTVRIAVPDLGMFVREYLDSGDANNLVARTGLGRDRPRTVTARLRQAWVGDRGHVWMYDGHSMTALLEECGLSQPKILPAGATTIEDPGPLDLREREDESVYVEARKP